MKKLILFSLLASFGYVGFGATVTITNSGNTFSSSTVTIALGDIVDFSIGNIHNAVEVSQATWNDNGNTPLSGGFSLGFGGGIVPAEKLTVGTHYYVCSPHAEFGMKGTIIVLNTTGLAEKQAADGIFIFPNPSKGNFNLEISASLASKKYDLGIYNAQGKKVYSKSDIQQQNTTNIEISDLPKGTYFVRVYGRKENIYKKIVVQ